MGANLPRLLYKRGKGYGIRGKGYGIRGKRRGSNRTQSPLRVYYGV